MAEEYPVTIKNMKAVIGTVYEFRDVLIFQELARFAKEAAENIEEETRHRVPIRYGFMYAFVESRFYNAGLAFEVGWWRERFEAIGERFYPPYVEYGTYKARAQPSLFPAYRQYQGKYERDVSRALSRAIARIKKNG